MRVAAAAECRDPLCRRLLSARRFCRVLACGFWLLFLSCTTDDCCSPAPQTPDVMGSVVAVDGGRVLHVYGTHAERGYALGRLAATGIKRVFDSMFLEQLFASSDSLYGVARAFIAQHMILAESFRCEAGGMVRGVRDAGVSVRNSVLGRDIDSLDILVMSCLEELYTIVPIGFGCTSLSNWGHSTEADSTLRGELILYRHWDYLAYPSMIDNLTLTVHHPAEPDEQPWIDMGWAGMVGCCSGVNERRMGAFLNYGIVDTLTHPGPFLPVSFALRQAVEAADYNGDGGSSPADVADSYRSATAYFPAIVHAVSWTAADSHAIAIEVNNHTGVQVRTASENGDTLGPYLIVANHFRVKYPPNPATVYPVIMDSLHVSDEVTAERQASIVAAAGGWSGNAYRVQYAPATGLLRWGCAAPGAAAYLRSWNEFSTGQLLSVSP